MRANAPTMTTWPEASAAAWPPAASPGSRASSNAPSEPDQDIIDFEDLPSLDGAGSDSMATMPPPSAGHGKPRSTRSNASSASSNGKTSNNGVSPGKQGNSEQQGGLKMCLMPKCVKPQKKKCRWCQLHAQHLDNLRYYVEHNKVNGSKRRRIAWSEEMKDVNKAIAAITQQEENNAGISKWKKTNKQHHELTWQEESGSRLNQARGIFKRPFEKEEFVIRQVNKKGWFDEFSRILLCPA